MSPSSVAADGGIGSMGEPLGVAPELVEAYVGLGRTTQAATGATARPRRPLPSEPLTSQETRVALLVARRHPLEVIPAEARE